MPFVLSSCKVPLVGSSDVENVWVSPMSGSVILSSIEKGVSSAEKFCTESSPRSNDGASLTARMLS